MVNLFREFEREKYGERVFKSLVQAERTDDVTKTFDENKKIAKSIRKKDIVLTEYPLEYDHMFDKKPELEIVFY